MNNLHIMAQALHAEQEGFKTIYVEKLDINMAYALRESTERGRYEIAVVSYNPRKCTVNREYDLSKVFQTRQEAETWLEELKQDIRDARSYHQAC